MQSNVLTPDFPLRTCCKEQLWIRSDLRMHFCLSKQTVIRLELRGHPPLAHCPPLLWRRMILRSCSPLHLKSCLMPFGMSCKPHLPLQAWPWGCTQLCNTSRAWCRKHPSYAVSWIQSDGWLSQRMPPSPQSRLPVRDLAPELQHPFHHLPLAEPGGRPSLPCQAPATATFLRSWTGRPPVSKRREVWPILSLIVPSPSGDRRSPPWVRTRHSSGHPHII